MSTCAECRFFSRNNGHFNGKIRGECRRYAPRPFLETPAPSARAEWPVVASYEFCGEFRPALKDGEAPKTFAEEIIEALAPHFGWCGHGSISVTCYICMSERLIR